MVRSRREGDALSVVVEDDGVGLPAGFDVETTGSLGLSIVRTLVGELGGTLLIEASEEGSGTRVEVQIPRVTGQPR